MRRAHRRVRRNLTAAARADGVDRDRLLHETRKAAKRLRYAAEAARPALGGNARRLAKRAEELQEVLGAHQDDVVTAPVLRRVALSAHQAGESSFPYGILYGPATDSAPDPHRLDRLARRLREAAKRSC